MFHFPTFPPLALCVQARVTGHDSSGVSPFGHPRIKARLPAPRGFSQVTTSFFGSYCQGIHHVLLETCLTDFKDARVHCAVLKVRVGPSTTGAYAAAVVHTVLRGSSRSDGPSGRFIGLRLSFRPIPQDPTVCLVVVLRGFDLFQPRGAYLSEALLRCYHIDVPSVSSRRPAFEADASPGQLESCQVLLRKEVIQPHLPVRLPCYDLVPIANPTLDGSFPKGLGHRLRVLPTFVT